MGKYLQKYNNLSKPVKAALWFTVCNFTLKGISFICMPLYTRLLSSDEYGKLSILTSYESIFIILATFELSLGAYQRGLLKYKGDVRTFEQSIVLLSNALTILFLIIVMLIWHPFSRFTGFSVPVFGLMVGYFVVFTPYNCWLNKKRFKYDYKEAVIVTLAMAVVANLGPILSLKVIGRTAGVKIGSTLMASIVFCLPFWIKSIDFRNIKAKADKIKEQFVYALRFQGPLVFHSLSYYVLNQADRVMIGHMTNNSSAAYYSVAYSLANVIIIFQTSLNQVLRPWRYQKLEGEDYENVRDTSNSLIALIGIVIVLFSLLVPSVLTILFKPEYYEAVRTMAPVAFGVFFLFLYTIFVDVESFYGKTQYIAYVSVFCAILNIVLNYFSIKFFGYIACAYTTLICYIIMAFLHYAFMHKTCKETGLDSEPVDIRFIVRFSLVMLLMFGIVTICYHSALIRYLACLIILIIGVIKRQAIRQVFIILLRERRKQ